MKNLFELLSKHGGKIVSTNDLNTDEINQARASNRMFVDEDSMGYVWLPPFHGRFPVTVYEVEMAEWCYPLDVSIPEEWSIEVLKKELLRQNTKQYVVIKIGNEEISNRAELYADFWAKKDDKQNWMQVRSAFRSGILESIKLIKTQSNL